MHRIITIVAIAFTLVSCGSKTAKADKAGADAGIDGGGADGGVGEDGDTTPSDFGTADLPTVLEPQELVTVLEWDLEPGIEPAHINLLDDGSYVFLLDRQLVRMLPDGTFDSSISSAPSTNDTLRYDWLVAPQNDAFELVALGGAEGERQSLVFLDQRGELVPTFGVDGLRDAADESRQLLSLWAREDRIVMSRATRIVDALVSQSLATRLVSPDPTIEATRCAALTPGVGRTPFDGMVGTKPFDDQIVIGGFIDTNLRFAVTNVDCTKDEDFAEVDGQTRISPASLGIIGLFVDLVDFAVAERNIYPVVRLDPTQSGATHLMVRVDETGQRALEFGDNGVAMLDRPGEVFSLDYVSDALWMVEFADGVVTTTTVDTNTGEVLPAVNPELAPFCQPVNVAAESDALVVLTTCADAAGGTPSRAAIVHIRPEFR